MSSAFLSIGFRPFYLGAAAFAALAVPAWMIAYFGSAPYLLPPAPLTWHAHEMVFGFAPAVIVGFLLTAVRNWTGQPTPSGAALAGLFGLWLAGRIAMLIDTGWIGLVTEVSFLPVAAVTVALPVWRARNHRNAFVVALLTLLALGNLAYQAAARGLLTAVSPFMATTLALDLVLILLIVIAGRVIPAFSANAIPGLEPRRLAAIEVLAIGAPVVLFVVDALEPSGNSALLTGILWAAAVIHVARLASWQPWRTWRDPLLLALPLAYVWIPVHLLLRTEWQALATHALTVGAMASLMLAMMTRSALGHTGRPLRAGAAELVMFAAIHAAALCRVLGPLTTSTATRTWLLAAAGLWVLAFGAFAVAYFPILTRPRVDGADQS